MKHLVTILAGLFLLLRVAVAQKSDLKILYVGGSTDWAPESFRGDTAAALESARARSASFETMLGEFFNSVTVVQAADYKQALSYQYDVTVMDGAPPAITPLFRERDAAGKITSIRPAVYFTEEFDRPVVMIGELGEKLGRSIGLKLDWYCLCLDADAHHLRLDHPIFRGPFPTTITTRVKPTPEAAFHYTYFTGTLPDSIPMWQVQTKGYATDDGFRIGMVARPWGFEDSPDAEYISSGVCAKTIDAVAIGRHGNFFHWGFAASPAYMTAEARAVLANAIVYIARFNGQGVIARKYNDRIATREYLKELKYLASRESYEVSARRNEEHSRSIATMQEKIKERLAKGEKLTSSEASIMNYRGTPPISFEDHVKRYQKDFFHLFGLDSDAYIAFYDANRDYFHASGFYHIEVDEDVKSLGIPNNDPRLLDAAITLLEKGKETDKARRILARYTLVDFPTAAEWRAWYEHYKEKLFFTEPGGWLFLINSREPGLNDYHARDERVALATIRPGETDDLNPVKMAASVVTLPGGARELVVKIKIHPGYHIYANVAGTDPFTRTSVAFELPAGYALAGELQYPSSRPLTSNGTTIYEDEILFRQPITGNGDGDATCTITYQCCDAHLCMSPATGQLSIKL
ncbi:MAG: protein-disulfide reductase DsbD N-terminal domain-containing protein [Odoribacteraceae bacterium]|jgi:hypothetical protein|nr:protein-disulfide reductase DsbD N-terminal domain-containing protein [Odoribacteraceae bacterium]